MRRQIENREETYRQTDRQTDRQTNSEREDKPDTYRLREKTYIHRCA